MPARIKPPPRPAPRDPERSRRRILDAALQEFSARGIAGARVDAIARRARINKRMLYHYYGDKAGLFRAVLRHKIHERQTQVEAQLPAAESASRLAPWFRQNCRDADWVRLLAWESLQTAGDVVLDERERRRLNRAGARRIQKRQQAGWLRNDVPPAFLRLAKISLAMFPMAMPQVARLVTGRSPHNPRFQRDYARFLETISTGFRPTNR